MKKVSLLVFLICISSILTSVSSGKDLPKIAVWDLAPGNIPPVLFKKHSQNRNLFSKKQLLIGKMKRAVNLEHRIRTGSRWLNQQFMVLGQQL
jgi:hypothetical protein